MAGKRKVVVLLSGGLDSAANLAFASLRDHPVLALTIDYGQRAAFREIQAAKKLARFYRVPHQVVEAKWLGALGGSALTDRKISLPQFKKKELDQVKRTTRSARQVWVPNRNSIFIAIASAYAESQGASAVCVGFNREEAQTFPDNSTAYLKAATIANRFSTHERVKVVSYTDKMDKIAIVRGLRRLPKAFPFGYLWSCYGSGKAACGKCESCARLSRALNT